MPGVRISKGMTVGFPEFTLQIRPDGSIESSPVVLHVRFDVCPTWIGLASKHVAAAKAARQERQAKWATANEETRDQLLESEFESSMQAIVSAGVAWDALYAMVRDHASIPSTMAERWRHGRTARYTQVAEVVRRAFKLKGAGASALRGNLKEIFRYRDRAVHPSGKLEAAVHHPELDVGVEWRFVFFRAKNAEFVVSVASAMLWDLAHKAKPQHAKVVEYQKLLARKLQVVFPQGRPNPEPPGDA
jgi:hypothetical protein